MLIPAAARGTISAVAPRPPTPAIRRRRIVHGARYILSGAAEYRHVTHALPVAELCRAALMGIFGSLYPLPDGRRGRSAVLAGKNDAGTPLSGHQHAYYLPTDENADGLLDHITLYAHDGFDAEHQTALGGLQFLRLPDREQCLELELASMGMAGDLNAGPLAQALCWQSATPYVATRFARTRGKNRITSRVEFLTANLAGQLTEFCQQHGGVAVAAIEPIVRDGVFYHPCYSGAGVGDYMRSRVRRVDDGGMRYGGYFRVRFTRPVHGPVVAGHNAHYGMGLFLPAAEMNPPGTGSSGTLPGFGFPVDFGPGTVPAPGE